MLLLQCNNPLTKEPKLQAAQRIVAEWGDYDDEVKVLWDRIYKGKSKTASDEAQASETKKGKSSLIMNGL